MISIKDLQRVKKVVKVLTIIAEAGLSTGSFTNKLLKGHELRIDESRKIEEVFRKYGIKLEEEGTQ